MADDTDSDSADASKPKAWKHIKRGAIFQGSIDEVIDDPFPHTWLWQPWLWPFCFRGHRLVWSYSWCWQNTMAEKATWRESGWRSNRLFSIRGSRQSTYAKVFGNGQFNLCWPTPSRQDASLRDEPVNPATVQLFSSSRSASVVGTSTDKPRLLLNNPFRPYVYVQHDPRIIDLTGNNDSDDDFFHCVWFDK